MKTAKNVLAGSFLIFIAIFVVANFSYAETVQEKVSHAREAVEKNPELLKVFRFFMLSPNDIEGEISRFDSKKNDIEKQWLAEQAGLSEIKNLGTTRKLEILPLIDWKTKHNKLRGEPGVSYLIKTDHNTILFDVGFNQKTENPSPLIHNMAKLGISLDDFDSIVISHNHIDHVGGARWHEQNTFSLDYRQIDLTGKKVYTPIPMSYPGLDPTCTEKPTKIGEGVTTIGTIKNAFFFLGETSEQALAVNVEKLGIVIIVGCGHQTVQKIIDRAKILFKEPIFALIGGLHFPVTDSRMVMNGVKIQKYVGIGRYPWQPFVVSDVKEAISCIKTVNPKIVALSSHDSCDVSLSIFKDAFNKRYKDIVVGEPIVIASQ